MGNNVQMKQLGFKFIAKGMFQSFFFFFFNIFSFRGPSDDSIGMAFIVSLVEENSA